MAYDDDVNRMSPTWWQDQFDRFYRVYQDRRREYKRYAKRFAGEPRPEGVSRRVKTTNGQYEVEANMLHLVVRSIVSDMMFRNPRFVSKPVETFGRSAFTPKLSRLESKLLNDAIEDVHLFHHGRRVLTDMALGYLGVFKVGYSADIAVDDELIDANMKAAERENVAIMGGRRPQATPEDLHKTHIERHTQLLALIEKGDLPDTPDKYVDYLKKHIKKHQKMLEEIGERPTETIRHERVFCKRINPLAFLFDPLADEPEDREWVAQMFLRPVEYVKNDTRYNPEARAKVAATQTSAWGEEAREEKLSGMDLMHDSVLLYEVIDLREGKVLTFAHGASELLRIVPYKLKSILPSGPYIDGAFVINPLTDMGICPPKIYEGHQEYLALLESTIAEAAAKSVPMTFVSTHILDETVQKSLESGEVGLVIPLKNPGPTDDIRRHIQAVPPAEISPTLMLGADRQMRFVERLSGKGSARLAGGDFSQTATASAVVNESSSTLAQDQQSVWDDMLSRVGRYLLRLIRRFYTGALVAELVGDEALELWPKTPPESDRPNGLTDRDIVQDKNVLVVPGSMKKRDEIVEQKLLTEFYAALMNNPLLVQAIGPETHIEILERLLDTVGLTDIDLEAAHERMAQAMEQQKQMQAGGPTDRGPADRLARRGQEGASDQAGIAGGLSNVGGGRVLTGASAGDRQRAFR